VGYTGDIEFDLSKPDGSPRKIMDSQRINSLGWKAQIDLENGRAKAYGSFLKEYT